MNPAPPPTWKGRPERLPDAFNMIRTRGARTSTAACVVWTHPHGWELRLMINGEGAQLTSVAHTVAAMRSTVQDWHHVMLETGWSDAP